MISAFRSTFRLMALLWTVFEAALQFLVMKVGSRATPVNRAEWLHRACSRALRRLGIAVITEGEVPSEGLIVANHLSYLDILALSAVTPCAFIAKKEVRKWPIFGWMANTAGTLFVDRERKLDTGKFNQSVDAALQSALRVVLFPEGTSTDGSSVLPFRPSLLEPAVAAGSPITPAWIGYEASRGSVRMDVCFWGEMTLAPHALKLFAIPSVTTIIRFGPALRGMRDRKQAAELTRAEVVRLGNVATTSANDPAAAKVDEKGTSRMGA